MSPTESRVAVVLVNGRVYCGPLLRIGRDVRAIATAARNHAKRTGREREVDAAMLNQWERTELARRIEAQRAVGEAELQP